MASYFEVAVEAAREAGAILLSELDRPVKIDYKGEADIVTQADRRSEQAILARIRDAFPKHAINAEESGEHSAQSAAESGTELCWYVDPLDGTTNFAHGYSWFCVSIGLARLPGGGQSPAPDDLLLAVIYQPISGELFSAVRGEGAYRNNKRIHVSTVDSLAHSLLGTGFPAKKRQQSPNIHYYWNFTLRSHGVRRAGSAALDLATVASGHFEGFWEFGLKPWDCAAGTLLICEAGGTVTDFAGNPYRLGGREIVASNKLIHGAMLGVHDDILAGRASADLPEISAPVR